MEALIFVSLGMSTLAIFAVITIALFLPTRADRAHMIADEVADQLARRGVPR